VRVLRCDCSGTDASCHKHVAKLLHAVLLPMCCLGCSGLARRLWLLAE
jgi:hypothetical protein